MRNQLLACLPLVWAAWAEPRIGDPLAQWRGAVKVRPVSATTDRHTVHTYFNLSPESPDGRWVLFYASKQREGYTGEIRIQERATGKEIVLARNVTVEDAHRAACQQWVAGGRRVVFHDVRGGEWMVVAVDVATRGERILARGRQVAWGQPDKEVVPTYAPHWAPGPNPDLEIVDVETGRASKVVTAASVREQYPDLVAKEFGDRPISIFFPIMSPDLKRVVFKMATSTGNDFRSKAASHRELLVGYDLERKRFLFCLTRWGHPSWLPDSRTILNTGPVLIDSDTGSARKVPSLPVFPGSHPSMNRSGELFATDTLMSGFGGGKTDWGVAVGDIRGGGYKIVHSFANDQGAASWRVSHPHPAFSADGKRLYFNVNDTAFTRLFVAEAP